MEIIEEPVKEIELPIRDDLGISVDFNKPEFFKFYEEKIYPYIDTLYRYIKEALENFFSNISKEINIGRWNNFLYEGLLNNLNVRLRSLNESIKRIKSTKNAAIIIQGLENLKNLADVLDQSIVNKVKINVDKIINYIKEYFEKIGYSYRYFRFFNNKSYMYQINVNKSKIRFDIAESGYSIPDSKELAKKAFDQFRNVMKNMVPMLYFRNNILNEYSIKEDLEFTLESIKIYNYIGWSRDELINALSKSEYFQEEITEITNDFGTKYKYRYPAFGVNYIIKRKRKLPILEYISRSKLELIYKYINNYNHINFHSLCKVDNIDDITFHRMLDKFDPTFLKGNYRNLSVSEICEKLGTESIRKSMLEIPQLSQDIIYQPGGKYEKRMGLKHKMKGYENIKDVEMKEIYKKYINKCDDPSISTQSIIFDAIELGLIDMIKRDMTREQFCEVITKFLKNLYGDIEFD